MTTNTEEEGANSVTDQPAEDAPAGSTSTADVAAAVDASDAAVGSPPDRPLTPSAASSSPPVASRSHRAAQGSSYQASSDFRATNSEKVIAACSEIYAVSKTALDELNLQASGYLTFQQKKRIHSQMALFGSSPEIQIPGAALARPPERVVSRSGDSISVEEIEQAVLSRVQDQLSAELARLANRAAGAVSSSSTDRKISDQLEGLAGALRALERSLPERIGEVVDTKISSGNYGSGSGELIQAIEGIRAPDIGFSIADLDLGAIAEITDRPGANHLPRISPEQPGERTLPYGSLDPEASSQSASDSDQQSAVEQEISTSSSMGMSALDPDVADSSPLFPPPSDEPQTAVVFLDETVDERSLPEVDEDLTEDSQAWKAGESFDEEQTIHVGKGSSESPVAESQARLSSEPTGDDLVLAPMISDEDQVEVDLGLPTGDLVVADDLRFAATPEEAAESLELDAEVSLEIEGETAELDKPTRSMDEGMDDEEATVLTGPVQSRVASADEASPEESDRRQVDSGFRANTGYDDEELADPEIPNESSSASAAADTTSDQSLVDEPVQPKEIIGADEPTVAEGAAPALPGASLSAPENNTEIELRLQHAADLRGRNKLAEAMQQYDEVIAMAGPNYEAHIGRGVVFLQTRNYDRAKEEFSTAGALDTERPAGALGLAEVSFHQKDFAQAISHYSTCIQLDPRLAQAFRNRGLCHYHQEDFEAAASDLRKAYELDPDLPNIKKYLQIARNKLRTIDRNSSAEASA